MGVKLVRVGAGNSLVPRLSLVFSVTSASVTRQSFVEGSKYPWACLGEKSRLEFVKVFFFFEFFFF